MINRGLYFVVLSVFCITNILSMCIAPYASAQSIRVLGEIRAEGTVLVSSSDGQWAPISASYPLLQSTSVRTADGVASIFFRDGSRISLYKDTFAVVDGSPGDYSVSLSKGVMAFNISSSASLSVATASGSITTLNKKSLVQKVSYEETGRVLGVISTGEKGTEVRSISGRLQVNINASETMLIMAGESIFLGPDSGGHIVYKAQALPPDTGKSDGSYSSEERRRAAVILADGSYSSEERRRAAVILALFLGGSYCAFNCPGKGLASPSR
jgi:hypothetical protein